MEIEGSQLSDPEKRAEASRFAEELLSAASSADREVAAEMLLKAAEIYHSALGDLQVASSLLRRALQANPHSKPALARLRDIAEVRGDWSELADVLEAVSRLPMNDEQRALLSAERGDLLAGRLGRIAEARGLYREAARLSADSELRDGAREAAERIEAILSERRPHGPPADWHPVARSAVAIESLRPGGERVRADSGTLDRDRDRGPGAPHFRLLRAQGRLLELLEALVGLADRSENPAGAQAALREAAQLAAGPLADMNRAIELYARILERDPIDEEILAEAIARGVRQGQLDIARRVLPRLEQNARARIIGELAQAATVAGDERAALEYRAAAFEDAPAEPASFQAAVQILRSKQDEEGLGRALEKRLRAVDDTAERRAILFELATLREARGQVREAAEALLESIRTAGGEEEVTDALAAIDRLSVQARDRTLLTRAHGAAAARSGIAPEAKAQHMRELVRILGEELGDDAGAKAALRELDATTLAEGDPAPRGAPESAARGKDARAAAVGAGGRPETGLRARPRLAIDPASDPFSALDGRPLTAAPVSDSDWGQAVQLHSLDTVIDERLSAEERSRLLDTIHGDAQDVQRADPQLSASWTEPRDPLEGPADDAPTPISGIGVVVVADEERSAAPAPEAPHVAIELPATRSRPSDVVLASLRRGELDEALDVLSASVVSKSQEVETGLWIKAGRLAVELGRESDAQACFARAVEVSKDEIPLATDARRALSGVNARLGAYRAAAQAIAPLLRARSEGDFGGPPEPAERAEDLLLLGRCNARAGDRATARAAFEEALGAALPTSAVAAGELVGLLAIDQDAVAIAELASRIETRGLTGELRAEWLVALAGAWRELPDPPAAKAALTEALAIDRTSLKAAEMLVALGQGAGRDAWIDEGLRELRLRSIGSGTLNRAFAAAAVLVAREVAEDNDRSTYESLRVALRSRPRAPLGLDWIRAWLDGAGSGSDRGADRSSVDLDGRGSISADLIAPGPPAFEAIVPEPALAEAIDVAAMAVGLGRIDLYRLEPGKGPIELRFDPVPALGLGADLLGGGMPHRALRFEIARAVVALAEPRLARSFADPPSEGGGPASRGVVALDRAAMVLSGDPAVAIGRVGARTARGGALAELAVSRELPELWSRLGLGIPTRAGLFAERPAAQGAVAKGSTRD